MKKVLLLLTMVAMSTIGKAQVSIDFEPEGVGADLTWNVFENTETAGSFLVVDNPDATGANTSTKVGQFIARAGGQPWAGLTGMGLAPFIFDETNRVIKVMVWKSVISDVGIKLETASKWAEVEIKVANTKINEWEELTFDFTGRMNPPNGEPFTGVSFYPDFKEGRGQDNTVYFDNFSYEAAKEGNNGGGTGGNVEMYCEKVVTHFGIEAETASAIKLTIANRDASSMIVVIESANADPVDLLIVNSSAGDITGAPSVSATDATDPGKLKVVLTWAGTPPAEVSLNILWSKVSSEGNWQLGQENKVVAFNSMCTLGGGGDGEPGGTPAPVVVNFEPDGIGTDLVWNVFENTEAAGSFLVIDNPDANGLNTSSKVAQFIARAGGQPWAGATGRGLAPFLFDETNRVIKVMVWKSVISDFGIKLETESKWAEVEIKVANTKVNEWEELTFDFTGRMNPPAGEPFTGISFYPDFKEGRGQDNTVYIDNFTYDGAISGGNVGGPGGNLSQYCETVVKHLGIPAEEASAIKLTIANRDATSMEVVIESANADPVDLLIVNSSAGDITGAPAVSAMDTSEPGKIKVVLTWTGTPPAEVSLNILWSKVSSEGNWQLGQENTTVAFTSNCSEPGPTAPVIAAPVPTQSASDVVSIFSNTYGNLTSANFNPGWGQATVYSTLEVEGNETIKYAGLNYQGIDLGTNLDVSGMLYLHVDFWTANSSSFNVFLISPGAPAVERSKSLTVPSTTWTSMDIPLSEFSPVELDKIFQFKFDGNGDVFVDNIYFHKGEVVSVEDDNLSPSNFTLTQNYPNPFNPSTKISYSTKSSAKVTLEVYNVMGQKLATLVNGIVSAGNHTVTFDASGFASGMYLYKLTAGNYSSVKSMTLIK